jgi:hypothetical protein
MKIILGICVLALLARPSAAQDARPGEAGPTVEERGDSAVVHSDEDLKKAMATAGMTELPSDRAWERKKSATVAVLSSMLLPGLGQAYNGRKLKAGVFMGLFTFYASTAYVERKSAESFLAARDSYPTDSAEWVANDRFYQFHRDNAGDYMWWAGAVWFFGLLDAFVDAHLYDVRAVDPAIFKGAGGQKYAGLSIGL